MTREELINHIKYNLEINADVFLTDEDARMTIKALEQEPCEDAISRQAALGCCRNEWEEEVEIRLKSLPPVNPQPKTGKWEDSFDVDEECNPYPMVKCSLCKEQFLYSHNYCPNCGAKMIEPQESE